MKYWCGLLLSFIFASTGFAQPANNNCGGATVLIPSSGCNPIVGNTASANQSQPGCTGTANDDVWYSFVATGPSHAVNVSGNGTFNPVLQVFSGSCGGSSLGCINVTAAGGTETFISNSFIMGITYWVRVYDFGAGVPSNTTFNICVSDPVVEPPCDPNSVEPANSVVPCAAVPKICQVNGFCGTTQGYHATPTATTLTPYTVNTWPQLSGAFCGSIENNSFCKFEANASSVQLRIYGSCATGTGIQLLAFSYVNPTDCGTGAIVSYGCFSPLNLTAVPATGLPITFSGMIPGQTYYLMIDGFAGAICNYKIGADYGVQVQSNVTPATSTICLGNTVNLIASGGNGTYTWNANPDLSATTGSTVIATPVSLGQQLYIVNSASTDPSCPGTADTAIVNVTTIPTPNAGVDDTVCFNPNGVTTINLNGTLSNPTNTKLWQYLPPPGPPPTVNFTPNFSALNATVTVNQPGLYKFILRETSPICGAYRDTLDLLVMQMQQTLSFTPPSCAGLADGSITIVNSQADEFSFDNGTNWQPSNTQSGFAAGTYSVCSRNYLGCQVCSQITVVDPTPVQLSVSNDTTICENGTATLVASASGGNSFTYNWAHTSNTSGTQPVSPTAPGFYYVSATNNFGCSSTLDSIYVNLNPPLSGSITPGFTICPGDNAPMTATALGGINGPYTFTWSTLAVGSGMTHSINETPGATTTYTVTINDNCETTPVSYSTIVTVAPLPQPSFTILEDSICSPAVFTAYNTTNPATVQSALWVISDGQSFTSLDSIVTGPINNAGNYNITLTITSPDGCVNQVQNPIVSMPLPISNFRYSPNVVSALNTNVSFENMSVGASSYLWYFEQGNPSSSTISNPSTMFPEATVGSYMVQLFVESNFGCVDSSYQIIQVRPEVILYAPNTFTPDGDEFNATWRVFIEGIDPSEFELIIYDRWGEQIWINYDPKADWDGTFKGKPAQAGIYNWRLKAKDAITSESYLWSGHINILR